MLEEKINNKNPKEIVRCSGCDREVDHYTEFLSPANERKIICWECVDRKEKGFNAKRTFNRSSRTGVIPR